MAKIIENSKGFKVIEIDRIELIEKLHKFGSYGICDRCGLAPSKGFFIAVLTQWFCPNCYNKWCKDAIRHEEDKDYEERKFNKYRRLFNL